MFENIELIAALIALIWFFSVAYRKYVKPRFPSFSPKKFAILSAVGLAGLIVILMFVFTRQPIACANNDTIILMLANNSPVLKPETRNNREQKLRDYCISRTEQCAKGTSQDARKITSICDRYY